MVIDAGFAFLHFFGIGCLAAVLAMQTALLAVTPTPIERLNKIDMGLGLAVLLIHAAGAGRVIWDLRGADQYMGTVFWVKMALFFGAGFAAVLVARVLL